MQSWRGAIGSGNLEEVKRLVNEKYFNGFVDKDEEKQTLLHYLVQRNLEPDISLEIIRIILRLKKIDINAQDIRGLTALHCASFKGRVDLCLEILNQKNTNINTVNVEDNNALTFLCQSKPDVRFEMLYTITLKLLSSGVDLDHRNKYGDTALHCASDVGNLLAVNFLCTNNCNIDALNNDMETALHCAVRNMHSNVVMTLLEHGADTSIASCDSVTVQTMVTTEEIHLLIRGSLSYSF